MVFVLSGIAFSQGKGKGGGNSGRGNSGGVDRGNSGGMGRRNDGVNNDSVSHGKSDDKKNKAKENRGRNDNNDGILGDRDKDKSNRFKGLSKKTGLSEETLQARYEVEKRLNPDLTYGQFVAAHMLAKNHDGISTERILGGLRNGDSIGQILHNQGWDNDEIKKERKRIKKDRDKDKDRNYDDDNKTWRTPF